MRQINKIKENIKVSNIICKASAKVMVNEEIEIQKPGVTISRIVKESGKAYVDELRIRENQVIIGGVLDYQILYSEQKTGLPQCEMGQIRFEDYVKIPNIREDNVITVDSSVDWITVRVINDRKVIIKAQITVLATATDTGDIEVMTSVEKQDDMEILDKNMNLLEMVKEMSDTLRIKETVELPGGKPSLSYLLWKDVRIKNMEYGVINGKLSVSGELNVFYMYAPDDENPISQWQEFDIAFNYDLEVGDSNIIPYVEAAIQSMELIPIPNEMGDNKEVESDILLKINIKLFEEKEIKMIEDVYSLKTDMDLVKNKIMYNKLLVKNISRSRNVVKINIGGNKDDILQICFPAAEIRIEDISVVEDAIVAKGKLNVYVIYTTTDDRNPICTASKEVDFSHRIDAEGISRNDEFFVNWRVEQTTANMVNAEEIEVRINMAMEIFVVQKCTKELATDIKEEEMTQNKSPYIRAHVVQSGETLWKLAKDNRTTVDRIKEINNLKGDTIQLGDRLIVAK
ncbi:MAG: DUF3794 domain-containing protein [Lachnospiraceae bacterium]|nr:DUF3794 domain-containing protein [Lachnospiraceae bacterium]